MEKKIAEDKDLQDKMESALSNQEAEKQAYQVSVYFIISGLN